MMPFFTTMTVTSGTAQTLPFCNNIRIYSIAGSLTLSFNGGKEVPVDAGDVFKSDFPTQFQGVKATATAGDAVIIYGNGFTSNRAFATAMLITANPEGSVTAPPGRTAYNTTDGGYWVKATGSGNTGWVQLIA